MSWIDITVFGVYILGVLAIGFHFYRKNETDEDFYVGGRNMSAGHIGLSVVATDVGGGFSIGLGGLGFTMGLAGNWMLFTGLLGAWLSAVFLIPKVYKVANSEKLLSFPQALQHHYTPNVALVAGIISLIGYIGFTSSQVLAGAKLASATFPALTLANAVLIMGVVMVVYTVAGGMKAVVYTDTVQWIILMLGLIAVGIPVGLMKIGGWEGLQKLAKPELLSLTNVQPVQLFNWFITIVPIWFVGMTLFQRIYACRDEKTAIKAWRIAGFFEWPVMAFMGVLLGVFARAAFEQGMFSAVGYAPGSAIDAEIGLPLFLRHILPAGFMGIMMAAYFSAIMSTADSCLMAASGNMLTDVLGRFSKKLSGSIRLSQLVTFFIGAFAILLALKMQNVLQLMLHSYAFMVSGLFVPVLGMLFLKRPSPAAALAAMLTGGLTTLLLIVSSVELPGGLDANFFGLLVSATAFAAVQALTRKPISVN